MNAFKLLLIIALLSLCTGCSGQGHPKYIGEQYGTFDLDKITFRENPDSLLSKTEQYYKLPEEDRYFDDMLKRFVETDTLYFIYRIPSKYISGKMFRFKNFRLKAKEIVDFYVDNSKRLRKVETSVYMSAEEYGQLLAACKDFKDITPVNVSNFNNKKYVILQKEERATEVQTTLYCLDYRSNNDPGKDYFVRISKSNTSIRNDRFYKRENDEVK